MPDFQITVYIDASFASCPRTGRSTSAFLVYIGQNLVFWKSVKQPVVALSSTEAEYIALAYGIREAYFVRYIMIDLGVLIDNTNKIITVYEDNQSAIALGKEPALRKRSRGWDPKWHWVQDQEKLGLIDLRYIDTKDMVADIGTKPLGPTDFNRLKKYLVD